MNIRTISLSAAVLAAALVLTGCSGSGNGAGSTGDGSPSAHVSSATFNDADSDFAMGMVAHHEQAVEMSDMLLAKDGVDPEVVQLAQDIKEAQGPEIETMNSWLDAWGVNTDMQMEHGMMSDAAMAKLDAATGEEASALFLEQMIEHHEGAVSMAEDELDQGNNPDALALAQKIIDDQTAEIASMQDLLETL
ncbi:DUF305 domain-containing protein [Paramicrobacterium agarici]|uniref:DUF305 domain-containing protein n=1 Tax=Paramicrobacterium agarici TaxID=630514 RepID=UPI00114DFEED|nr:DUF305 domain-containing protein [Microbacterium agarici]